MAAGDDPVVRAGRAAVAGGKAEKRAKCAWVFVEWRDGRRSAGLGAVVLVVGVVRWGRRRVRLAPIDHRTGGWMIAPRADRVKIGLELGVAQFGGDPLAR